MSDHGLAFPDLESKVIKEKYPDDDDSCLLKRLQNNWSNYQQYWDMKTKEELVGLINGGGVETNGTNRTNASGHKSWKKAELTWAIWIVMRTHYGINKLSKLSWICPDQQLEGILMANAESNDGPLCIKPEEHSGKNHQGSQATSETGEVSNLEARTHTDWDSRKRAYSGTPRETRRVKRKHQSLRRSMLERMEDINKGVADTFKDMPSMISHQTARFTFPTNDTHIGTPLLVSNGSLLQRREQGRILTGSCKVDDSSPKTSRLCSLRQFKAENIKYPEQGLGKRS
ncbi:hypothetical protein FMUND_7577 [Fusarium mundagurra]|uniref:Uncharacterized protein n=1 Tax=Fusarium mundagurra TaxID=1567541 RepID=A0A8H5YL52_9HYPO|nr:hypothetical protein FMUND_7577 [Fusarium mundagurra]